MNNSVIRILLLGDYSIFRSALRMLIETDKKLRVIGEATDIDSAAEIVAEERPDLILVDLPEKNGHEQLGSFHSSDVPVLVLIGQYDVDVYQKCLRLGISGLVPKEGRSETLFRAIDRVFNGEIWFDRTIMGHTIRQLIEEKSRLDENPRTQANSLTDREQQVVELICKGLKNKDIADQLFITETTVRHHLTSVFNKLEISSRLELVVHAFKHNLVAASRGNGSSNGKNGNGDHQGNGNGRKNGNGNGSSGTHKPIGAFVA